MQLYGRALDNLIQQFASLPGIGAKSAQRLAFYIINQPRERALALAQAVKDAAENVNYCEICCNFTDISPCGVCDNPKRDVSVIMCVEDPRDMAAYERTGEYTGLYHVLHGQISPMNGTGPNELRIKELLKRLETNSGITELILATNPDVEGEATAMYINKLIAPLYPALAITRIARGVPVGGDIEYLDQITLARALSGRAPM